MNCYYHQNTIAVGTCKNCSKGLCVKCASDVGDGLACRDKCEQRVREINKSIETTIKLYARREKNLALNTGLYKIMGVIFLVPALYTLYLGETFFSIVPILLGITFIYYGYIAKRSNSV